MAALDKGPQPVHPIPLFAGESAAVDERGLVRATLRDQRRDLHRLLRRVLRDRLARRRITIEVDVEVNLEVNSTSNLVIGGFFDYQDLPYRVMVDSGLAVSVNTDDPGLFMTWRPNE